MAFGELQSVHTFIPTALAASSVGTWERDPGQGIVHCDAVMARIYGLDQDLAVTGVSLARLRQAIHPDDRFIFSSHLQAQAHRGGLMVIEYRVQHADGTVRWVLVRGHYEPIEPGQPIAGGRGIVIDVTECRLDGLVEGRAFIAQNEEEGLQPQHRAADYALALYAEAKAMGAAGTEIAEATKRVMFLLATCLAKDMSEP